MHAIDSLADKSDEPNCKTINHVETWRGSPFSALMLMFYFVLREKWMKIKETNLIKYIPLLCIFGIGENRVQSVPNNLSNPEYFLEM